MITNRTQIAYITWFTGNRLSDHVFWAARTKYDGSSRDNTFCRSWCSLVSSACTKWPTTTCSSRSTSNVNRRRINRIILVIFWNPVGIVIRNRWLSRSRKPATLTKSWIGGVYGALPRAINLVGIRWYIFRNEANRIWFTFARIQTFLSSDISTNSWGINLDQNFKKCGANVGSLFYIIYISIL